MSYTPKWLLNALDERDGHVCAWYGYDTGRLVPQHRHGGMGGRKDKHRLSNVVWIDSLVNGLLESDPEYQREGSRRGLKISGFANPLLAPVDHPVHGIVLLGDDGSVSPLTPAEAAEWRALQRAVT